MTEKTGGDSLIAKAGFHDAAHDLPQRGPAAKWRRTGKPNYPFHWVFN
jgi:hypothetical protein